MLHWRSASTTRPARTAASSSRRATTLSITSPSADIATTPNGTRITFTHRQVAATSKQYGQIFQARRSAAEGHSIRLQGDVGYDLGSRGLPAGDMWMVQLLSDVPWIYNESGGNSAGMSGLDSSDKQKYAQGLVDSVERCVPIAQ